MRCAECRAKTAEATGFCSSCGAPAVCQRSALANPPTTGADDDARTDLALPRDTWPPIAWIRRGRGYFLAVLVFCLGVYMFGVVGVNKTTQGSGLHRLMLPAAVLGLAGALLSLVLVEAVRNQFRPRQVVWALVPIVSEGFLAFVPFVWLALIRRRAREWVVSGVYLAAASAQLYLYVVGYPGSPAWSNAYVIMAGLMVIAPVHAVLAFSPTAGVSSWRDIHAARLPTIPTLSYP